MVAEAHQPGKLAGIQHLGRRIQSAFHRERPTPELQPQPNPSLMNEAMALWRVVDPNWEPDIKRAAYFRFGYTAFPWGEHELTPEEAAFDKVTAQHRPIITPFHSPTNEDNQKFGAILSINPKYLEPAQYPQQDFESRVSFDLKIYSLSVNPDSETFRANQMVMRIMEIYGSRWYVFASDFPAAEDHEERVWYDLTGYDAEKGELDWKRVHFCWEPAKEYPYIGGEHKLLVGPDYQPNHVWKRNFVQANLARLTAWQENKGVLSGDDFGFWLDKQRGRERMWKNNEATRASGMEGKIEWGSIANGINHYDAISRVFGH